MDTEGPRPGNLELSQPIAKQSTGKRGSATDRAHHKTVSHPVRFHLYDGAAG